MPDTLPILFLDDGGVLNDNTVRAQQWQRLVGEFMPPRLGGTPAGWAEANRVTVPPLLAGFEERSLAPGETYADWERACDIAWLRGMCGHLGIEPPPDDEAARIGREAEAYICARVRSAFPGAAGAVRRLAARGFTVHTASDKSSTQLHAYLAGMGIRQHFGHLFGPDLVDEFKWRGPGYYERIFAASEVDPRDAVVIDDNARFLGWARETGAAVIHVSSDAEGSVSSLAAAVDRLLEQHGA